MDDIDYTLMDIVSRFDKIKQEEYYLSYSGGKDSHLLYWIIKEYAPKIGVDLSEITIVAIDTYLEHKEIRDRMYKNSNVILHPILPPLEIIGKYGSPCFSKTQDQLINTYQVNNGKVSQSCMNLILGINGKENSFYKLNNTAKTLLLENRLHKISDKCCYYMKKKPARIYEKENNKKVILGVRASEGKNREARYKGCFSKKGEFQPLWDLSNEMAKKIYEKYNIEIPNIYNYVDRTGCAGCPYGSYKKEVAIGLALLPKSQYKLAIKMFENSYKVLNVDYEKRVLRINIFDENLK